MPGGPDCAGPDGPSMVVPHWQPEVPFMCLSYLPFV